MPSLSLSSSVAVLPCPTCGQTINTSMQACPYCAATIDHDAAASSAEVFAQINQSISDASYLKVMAIMTGVFFLTMFLPFLSMIGYAGFVFLEFAIPAMSIRWWVKFGALNPPTPNCAAPRRIALFVSILGTVLLLNLLSGLIFRHHN